MVSCRSPLDFVQGHLVDSCLVRKKHLEAMILNSYLALIGMKCLVSNVNVKLSYVVQHVSEAPLVKLESCINKSHVLHL